MTSLAEGDKLGAERLKASGTERLKAFGADRLKAFGKLDIFSTLNA